MKRLSVLECRSGLPPAAELCRYDHPIRYVAGAFCYRYERTNCPEDRIPESKVPQTIRRRPMNYHLTPEEQRIEKNAHQLRSVSDEKRARVESIIDRARKNQAIILRLSGF
ncbi:hypothetical protein ES705_45122 [subsurface metagenome]